MKTKLVRLPDGTWVNAAHVTCIEIVGVLDKIYTKVWVEKSEGYRTGAITFYGDCREELANIINAD